MIKHLGNQLLSWFRDRNIRDLSIYCSYWNTLNLKLRTSLYMRYLILKYQYHSENAIKDFTIHGQYNKNNAYWTDLFTHGKSWIKKIGMDMRYLLIFNFLGLYIFKVPIVYYYLVISILNWWKIRHLSSKSLSWWYIHAYPVSYKIIYQVSVQTLICVCISITNCKNKIVYFRGSDMDI